MRIAGQAHQLVSQGLQEGLQQVADGTEIGDVRIEEPGDFQHFVDDVLGVLQRVHRIERLEIADRGGEHPFDPSPAEGRDFQRIGEVRGRIDQAGDRLVDLGPDILRLLADQGQVAADEGHLLLERRDAEGRCVDQVSGQFQLFGNGAGDGLAGILRQGLGLLETATDFTAYLGAQIFDGGQRGGQVVGHRRAGGIQPTDEGLRQLERHFLLPDHAQEI